MAQVVGCSSARVVWLSLESTYSSISQARVIQTQLQLASLKNGANTISTYFHKAKGLSDIMVVAGRPLSHEDFLPYLIAGLGPDYRGLVTFVTTRLVPISLEELLRHLLAHEARLLHHYEISTFPTKASAKFTAKSSSGSHGRENHGGCNFNQVRNGGRSNNNRGRGNYASNTAPNSFSSIDQHVVC
ncbi:hypothetical protein F2P56_023396 [Juglans regia]|uniref:Uncharacterized protein n=1 Tax=Juglans regia TaxID=51240 RepID=A0A833UA41_JUGRE|nr:hypothetical protein F2P56_023396 [Juglans regia]